MRPHLVGLLFLLSCAEPPAPGVPPDMPGTPGPSRSEAPDFSSIVHVPTLKRTFYEYLHPMVVAENDRIRTQRLQLRKLRHKVEQHSNLSASQQLWLAKLADEYRLVLSDAPVTATDLDHLMSRVDVVPKALALAQAAIESGWGRSRFARLSNNLYGEWCFKPGCGIVPQDRNAGALHEIASFDSPANSIRSYMRNLNTHGAYDGWRDLRRSQREAGDSLFALKLAARLTAYSELREEYVQRVRDVIRQNADLIPQARHAQ